MGRMLPALGTRADRFWLAGAEGQLEIQRCAECRTWNHPPGPVCRNCHGRDLAFSPTSGRGTIHSFTINLQPWRPDMPVPLVIASVELVEQSGLYLTTNIVDCEPDAVRVGDPVMVTFIHDDDVWLPVFRLNRGSPT